MKDPLVKLRCLDCDMAMLLREIPDTCANCGSERIQIDCWRLRLRGKMRNDRPWRTDSHEDMRADIGQGRTGRPSE